MQKIIGESVYYQKILKASQLLRLDDEASLKEIKSTYRKLSLKYHPDTCRDSDKKKCERMFKQINDAYNTILDYCETNKCSLVWKDVESNDPDRAYNEHVEKFYSDWFL